MVSFLRRRPCLLMQSSDTEMRMLQQRLEVQEQRQVQMMQFLSKALQHPEMLQQLVGARQNVQRISGGHSGESCWP